MPDNFFRIVDQRNADREDGPDPNLRRRMAHPWCLECQAEYRKKFPGKPFKIKCEGVYALADMQQIAEEIGEPLEAVRSDLDLPYWANQHYKVPDSRGNLQPFVARDYQERAMRCTASRMVDRWSRGLGKTTVQLIRRLHRVISLKNFPILVLCPAQHQAAKWYTELVQIIDSDAELRGACVQKKQAPFYLLRFSNGSSISIFTAGSKSGRGADSIRSQSPREITLEEQDLLNEKDYSAISPLFDRYTDELGVGLHGSSTPLGKRETYWEMCTRWEDVKEFHFPISRHPDWGPEKEEKCRREARTEIRYLHEFEAEFGDQESGVFKALYIDASRQPYDYELCQADPQMKYWMGVDWNKMKGTGTRIRVVEFNPATSRRRMVDHLAIDDSNVASINAIRAVNRKWKCEGVCVDAGFGGPQGELLQLLGSQADFRNRASLTSAQKEVLDAMGTYGNPEDAVLRNVQIIDFGATLTFNKLVPNRGNTRYLQDEELERRTKPFMVEGAVMCLEGGLFSFSTEDALLDEQFRAYTVKTWSQHGYANTYSSGAAGDHDLDAVMLALLGIELKYGIFYRPKARPLTANSLSMVSGFGQQAIRMDLSNPSPVEKRVNDKAALGVPSRQVNTLRQIAASASKTAAMQRGNSFMVTGTPSIARSLSSGNAAASRTGIFRGKGTAGYGRGLDPTERRRFPL